MEVSMLKLGKSSLLQRDVGRSIFDIYSWRSVLGGVSLPSSLSFARLRVVNIPNRNGLGILIVKCFGRHQPPKLPIFCPFESRKYPKLFLFAYILLLMWCVFYLLLPRAQAQWMQLGADIHGEAELDMFGQSVSLNESGNVFAIGAHHNGGNGTYSGHVRIYEWLNGSWVQRGEDIDGEDAFDISGYSVALNSEGDVVVIGAFGNDGIGGDGSNFGQVRVYQWNGSIWEQRGEDMDGLFMYEEFGYDVDINGDGDVIAASGLYLIGPNIDLNMVRVYEWNGESWVQRGSTLVGAEGEFFGTKIALSKGGDVLAIGVPYDDTNGLAAGSVRVYYWDGTAWEQRGEDIEGEGPNNLSGSGVSLNATGSIVAVGALYNDGGEAADAGHVRVYEWDGLVWNQLGEDIDGESAGDYSGYAVSLNDLGDVVAIGAPGSDASGKESGQVRVYGWDGMSWEQRGMAIDGVWEYDRLGYSVSLNGDGDVVAAGAPFNDVNGLNSGQGSVWMYGSSVGLSEYRRESFECLLYPNPVVSEVYLSFGSPLSRSCNWRLRDVHGRALVERFVAAGSRQYGLLLPEGLAGGMYLWTLEDSEGRLLARGKLVVSGP